MKNITKTAITIAAIAFSAVVVAHNSGNGRHSMMNSDNPQYQEMLERRNNPEAMQAWKESMREDPEAMFQWMEKMHANFNKNKNAGYSGCHGHWQDTDNTVTEK